MSRLSRPLAEARQRRANREGFLFLLPAGLIILIFGLWPLVFTVGMSLFRWRVVPGRFVGVSHYLRLFGDPQSLLWIAGAFIAGVLSWVVVLPRGRRVFRLILVLAAVFCVVMGWAIASNTGDEDFWASVRVTVWYALGTVPAQLAAGLSVALLLGRLRKARQSFRVVFLLPYIVPAFSAAAIFARLFSLRPESFANQILAALGQAPQQWLGEAKGLFTLLFSWGTGSATSDLASFGQAWAAGPSLALVSVMIFNLWVFTGYYALIFAHGLAQIPRDLMDAASVDGAGPWSRFRYVTLPLLTPTTAFLSLLGLIGTFQSFAHIYVLRTAAAQGTSDPVSVVIFNTFFQRQDFGAAAAQAVVLLGIVLTLTVLQRRFQDRRVHDES